MKKTLKAFFVIAVVTGLCYGMFMLGFTFSTTAKAQQKEAVKPAGEAPPAVTLEQHDKISTFKANGYESYIKIKEITDKYDNAMKNDPEYITAKKDNDENSRAFTEYMAEISKGVDQKKWQFNYKKVAWEPVPPPETPKDPEKK
jgi:MFS superfamily sulfate permease-like transporter